MHLIKLMIVLSGLLISIQVNAMQQEEDESSSNHTTECGGKKCCGQPIRNIPGVIRNIVISPIAVFWDSGPTFAEW